MPSPPNLEGQGINILSSLLQVIPPIMDGMNAISITFSIRRSCVDPPSMAGI